MVLLNRIIWFLFSANVFLFAVEFESFSPVNLSIKKYFAENFEVNKNEVELKIIHQPAFEGDENWIVVPEDSHKLGHQTIFLKNQNNQKKYPVTIDISVKLPVWVANQKIHRKVDLKLNMFSKQKKWISRDFHRFVLDQNDLVGTMSIQVIKKGKILMQNMIKTRPDVVRGNLIHVELISGNLIIETKGKARTNGFMGHQTDVILDKTGKTLSGEIVNSNLVRVEVN
jgi:flagella basal body P-ring formation protein FlgA